MTSELWTMRAKYSGTCNRSAAASRRIRCMRSFGMRSSPDEAARFFPFPAAPVLGFISVIPLPARA